MNTPITPVWPISPGSRVEFTNNLNTCVVLLPVPPPPVNEQKRIVEINDSFSPTLYLNIEFLERLLA